MKYCPLMSFQKQYCSEMMCMEEQCGLADKDGNCLIATALKQYIAGGKIIIPTADMELDPDWSDK